MNENYVYIYPTDDTAEEFKNQFAVSENKNDKKIMVALIGAAVFFFILYFIPILEKFDFAFLICAIICGIFLSSFLKYSSNSVYKTALSIKAYEDYMTLEFYKRKTVKKLNIYYEDITDARFSDNNQTSFQIAFVPNAQSYMKEYRIENNEEIQSLYENLFLFNINPNSYEQFFFLYIAEDYFTIKGFHKTKKFFKKYGTQNEYLEKLEQNE